MTDAGEKSVRPSSRLRWTSAALGIPILLYVSFAGGALFGTALLLIAVLGLRELLRAYKSAGIRANPIMASAGLLSPAWPLLAGPSAIHLAAYQIYSVVAQILSAVLIVSLCWEVWSAARTGEMRVGRNIAYGLLSGSYIALFGGLGALREGYARSIPGISPNIELGAILVFLTLLSVWAADSFAYFTGRALGRKKLAPGISPNKTVEGSAGGLAAALLVGTILGSLLLRAPAAGLAIGAIAGIFGQLGDLAESALKREIGVKDLGGIIPGHGGILDRFDSLLFTAPIVAIVIPYLLHL